MHAKYLFERYGYGRALGADPPMMTEPGAGRVR